MTPPREGSHAVFSTGCEFRRLRRRRGVFLPHGDLYVGEAQAKASRAQPIDPHLDVPAAADTFGISRARAPHLFYRRPLLSGRSLGSIQIGSGDLDTDWALDAGREYVDAIADGLHP